MSPEIPTSRAPKVVDQALLGRFEVSKVAVPVRNGEPGATFSVGMETVSMGVVEAPFL